MTRRFSIPILLVSLLAGACHTVTLRDDIDLSLNFLFEPFADDDLHLPYVTGASVRLRASSTDSNRDHRGWSLESDNPDVLAVLDQDASEDSVRADCVAKAPGFSVITIRDQRGRVVRSRSVEVRRPDRVELLAHGPLLVGLGEEAARTERAKILTGGTATFLVRYYQGRTRLYGNRALSVAGASQLGARSRQTFLFENREWLAMSPSSTGTYELDLLVAGAPARTVPVEVVGEEAIARVTIEGQNEAGTRDGTYRTLLGMAFDRAGDPIYGVDFDWSRDDEPELGNGDLYRYEFERGALSTVEAARGGQSATAEIQAGKGYVSSSNKLGCSAAGSWPGGVATVLLVVLALFVVGRRRRAGDLLASMAREGPAGRRSSHRLHRRR